MCAGEQSAQPGHRKGRQVARRKVSHLISVSCVSYFLISRFLVSYFLVSCYLVSYFLTSCFLVSYFLIAAPSVAI
jgi:hypothetical protein